MRLPFYKYQATGNDFVIVNQTVIPYFQDPSQELVARLCDRRFGIGADGLMIIEKSTNAEFKMIYYNSDGRQSTMCGNGGRAIVHLAHKLNLIDKKCLFEAVDGIHEAEIKGADIIALKMIDVSEISREGNAFVLDTGSPHYVCQKEKLEDLDIISAAHAIRYGDKYAASGINVNFIEHLDDVLHVRTYERGVEDETYSCGTGVTAAAIAHSSGYLTNGKCAEIDIHTKGGRLKVKLTRNNSAYEDIWLIGPAQKVYEGVIDL